MKNQFFNLGALSEKQLDFFQYTRDNIDLLVDSTIIDISHLYGCGISFIYNFFENIGVTGLKDYIYKLGVQIGSQVESMQDATIDQEHNYIKWLYEKNNLSMLANNDLLIAQDDKIDNLCEDLKKARFVHCVGFGHSGLATHDLSGTLIYYGINVSCLDDRTTARELKAYLLGIKEDDLVIIYSFRGKTHLAVNIANVIRRINSNVKIWTITSNDRSPLLKFSSNSIIIDNNQKRINQLHSNLIISPLFSQVYFNDYLKNKYFLKYHAEVSQNQSLFNEIESWYDYSLIK